jgi:hypothetical protein
MHIILPDVNTLGDPLFVSPLTKHQTLTLLYLHAWLVSHAVTFKITQQNVSVKKQLLCINTLRLGSIQSPFYKVFTCIDT